MSSMNIVSWTASVYFYLVVFLTMSLPWAYVRQWSGSSRSLIGLVNKPRKLTMEAFTFIRMNSLSLGLALKNSMAFQAERWWVVPTTLFKNAIQKQILRVSNKIGHKPETPIGQTCKLPADIKLTTCRSHYISRLVFRNTFKQLLNNCLQRFAKIKDEKEFTQYYLLFIYLDW